jgi:hypothetical protein
MKTCLKCGHDKSLRAFPLDPNRRDGRHPYCKECRSEEQKARNRTETEARRRLPKRCRQCGKQEPQVEFPTRQSHKCWGCHEQNAAIALARQTSRAKEHYTEDRGMIRERSAQRREARKSELIRLLGGQCEACHLKLSPEWPSACFDFHHDGDKESLISRLIHSWKSRYGEILKEIKKCRLLCANCHRKYHAGRDRKKRNR